MHHNSDKRRTRVRLALTYSMMGIAIIGAVVVLVLILQGYRFNRYDGKVEQGGLVQFDSRPSGATVNLDGIALSAKTASKLTVFAGTHAVTMTKDGYMPWSKSVTVKAGGVLWLNYARLYPQSPIVSTAAVYDTVSAARVAPNRKQLIALSSSNQGVLYLTSLNDDRAQTRTITLNQGVLTSASDAASVSFSVITWDQDSQYVIIRHNFDNKSEYLSLNVNDGTTSNITKALGVDISKIEYVVGDHTAVYLLTTSHELRRGDLAAATISGPLVTSVADFAQADRSTVTYETTRGSDGSRSVGYLTNGASRPRSVYTVKDDGTSTLKFRIGTYYGDHFLVLAYGDTTTVYTADLPSSDSSSSLSWRRVGWLSTKGGVSYVGFSPETKRFVYAQMTDTIATYDLETNAVAKVTLQGRVSRELEWVDSFHIGSTANSESYFYDFDGTNGHVVATNVLDMPTTISENDKYFYYFVSDGTKVALKRVQLVN